MTTSSEHVAWCRYVIKHDKPTRIVLCDSDDEGAFKVYRSAVTEARRTGGLIAWTDALLIIQRGMDAYKARHPKWWRRMDGTPILNDLPVVIAEVVAQELHYPPSMNSGDTPR